MPIITRRQVPLMVLAAAQPARPPRVISHASAFHGWPTVFGRRNGELVLVYSGGRVAHVDPFGQVEMMLSRDNGESWTWPRVLLDTGMDDRDAGGVETRRGTLLVTTFTSLAYRAELDKRRQAGDVPDGWEAADRRLPDAEKHLASLMIRSTDGGTTWSPPYRVPLNSPHGPIETPSGRLLYAGKDLYGPRNGAIGVCESTDDGLTWKWLAGIPTRPGDKVSGYHELHMVEAPSGRLIAHIRNHNDPNAGETLQSESTDRGRTWSVPHPIGVWGLPSHLLRLRDGRLLMSYGYRRPPRGNLARTSADEGRTWSEPIVLSDDGIGDLGYPSTVQLPTGELLTVWYERMANGTPAVLRQLTWSL